MQKFDRLPSIPGVAIKLIETIQKSDPDIREITRLISSDAVLSAKLLKIVNSSFYGFVNKITTIEQAIKLLGLNTVKNFSLSLILKTSFLKKGPSSLNLASFWKDCLVGAIAAKLLAEREKIKNPEEVFFLGLLANIGSLTLAYLLPGQYSVVLSEIQTKKISSQDAENQVFGCNHMDIGALLTQSWGLPETFHIPIQHHHEVKSLPESCNNDIRTRTTILHLSSLYVELLNSGNMVRELGNITQFIKRYGLENSIDAVGIGKDLIHQTKDISSVFDLQFSDQNELESLLESAKQELLNISMQMVSDIIQKNKELETLRKQVNRDEMTQLHNYKAFCEALNQEIKRATRYKNDLSLILADIDSFKSINDCFGHPAGDQVLKVVARTLQNALRDCDFVSRYGGEEFAIILPETKLNAALLVAERLGEKIRALETSYDSQSIRVTISCGVAAFRNFPPMSLNDLVESADKALYSAKKQGRDRCCAFLAR
jgi:diguanylate cyclase (GGDEF)-like protein